MSTKTSRKRKLEFEPLLKLAKPEKYGDEYPARVGLLRINGLVQHGLFATRDVKQGEAVAEYGGRIVYKNDLPHEEHLNYCVALSAGQPSPLLVDHYSDDYAQSQLTMMDKMYGRYINSPFGRSAEGRRENVKIVREYFQTNEHDAKKCAEDAISALFVRIKFVAKCDIREGEEYCVNYGKGYPFFRGPPAISAHTQLPPLPQPQPQAAL